MKGEFLEPNHETPSMFTKLHHTTSHQHRHNLFLNPNFQATTRECQATDKDNTSRSSSGEPANTNPQLRATPTNPPNDRATIEVTRRSRGRPPGSKNKPKPPVFITRYTNEPTMSTHILEIATGNDVVEALALFCLRKKLGLYVFTGSGTVANVTLRQPSTTPGATVTFHGRFDILSICATFMSQTTPSCPVPNWFNISLAGPQGLVVGGLVDGPLLAAGTVYVIASSFNNPSYHRLPAEEDLRNLVP